MRYRSILSLMLIALGVCSDSIFPNPHTLAQEAGASLQKSSGKDEKKDVEPDVVDVVRVDATLVACDVLVLDKDGRAVKGLGAGDFIITEDDQPQEVATFGLGDDLKRPRSIVLIIDYSGSMLPYINTSIAAAKTLVDKLNPEDRMAIVTDDVKMLVDFTQDKGKLKEKLESLRKKATSGEQVGRSAQYSALMDILNRLSKKDEQRPIIIFQTDGDELPILKELNSEPTPPWSSYFQPRMRKEFSIADVFTSAQKSRVTLYSVIPGVKFIGLSPEERVARARAMMESNFSVIAELRPKAASRIRALAKKEITPEQSQRIGDMSLWMQTALTGVAKITGGWTEFLEKPDEAEAVYSRIFSDINQRYIIGYQPTNKARDGRLRKIQIEVRGHPDYTVWGRKSYYAPTQ